MYINMAVNGQTRLVQLFPLTQDGNVLLQVKIELHVLHLFEFIVSLKPIEHVGPVSHVSTQW